MCGGGGCGTCIAGSRCPPCRIASTSSYRKGIDSPTSGVPRFCRQNESGPLPRGGAGVLGQSLVQSAARHLESQGRRGYLPDAANALHREIRRQAGEAMLKTNVAEEKITTQIETFLDKGTNETWIEWTARKIAHLFR